MGQISLNEITSLINHQVNDLEKLGGCLLKLESLLRVVTSIECLQDLSASTLYGYFSVMEEQAQEASKLGQSCLDRLLKQ